MSISDACFSKICTCDTSWRSVCVHVPMCPDGPESGLVLVWSSDEITGARVNIKSPNHHQCLCTARLRPLLMRTVERLRLIGRERSFVLKRERETFKTHSKSSGLKLLRNTSESSAQISNVLISVLTAVYRDFSFLDTFLEDISLFVRRR